MYKRKSKEPRELDVPNKRGVKITTHLRRMVTSLTIDDNNLIANGIYYYKENGFDVILSKLNGVPMLISDLQQIQATLPELESNTDIFANLSQRLGEITEASLSAAEPNNYGMLADDWENDND